MPKKDDGPEMEDLCEDPVVIALDPGGTTGWAVWQIHLDVFKKKELPILLNILHHESGQFEGPEEHQAFYIMELIEQWPGAVVVIEDFIIRKQNADRAFLSPVRITAMVSFALFQRGESWFRQSASEAKSTITDQRLKSWGFYRIAGGEKHARDADRHALTWLRKMKGEGKKAKDLRAASWPYLYGTKDQRTKTREII